MKLSEVTNDDCGKALEEMSALREKYDLSNEDLYYIGAGLDTLEDILARREQ